MKLFVAIALLCIAARPSEACKHPPPCDGIVPLASDADAIKQQYSMNPAMIARALYTLARSSSPKSVATAITKTLAVFDDGPAKR